MSIEEGTLLCISHRSVRKQETLSVFFFFFFTLSVLNTGNLMLGRGYTDDEKDEKRSRAGGVNE